MISFKSACNSFECIDAYCPTFACCCVNFPLIAGWLLRCDTPEGTSTIVEEVIFFGSSPLGSGRESVAG